MLISFLDRSNPKFSSSLLGAQKIALNQFLENPIKPKTFIIKIDKIPKVQEILKTKLNKKDAAEILGVSRQQIYNYIKELEDTKDN